MACQDVCESDSRSASFRKSLWLVPSRCLARLHRAASKTPRFLPRATRRSRQERRTEHEKYLTASDLSWPASWQRTESKPDIFNAVCSVKSSCLGRSGSLLLSLTASPAADPKRGIAQFQPWRHPRSGSPGGRPIKLAWARQYWQLTNRRGPGWRAGIELAFLSFCKSPSRSVQVQPQLHIASVFRGSRRWAGHS
jgi:hypothetical protein